jgi:pimeloyl-ACP methyl ester carboxylesterase
MDFIDTFIKKHPLKQVEVNKELKEYLVGGNGKSAFLIFPGSGQDAQSCYDLIDAFEKKYKAIAINYDRFYTLDLFFTYVNAILAQEKVEKTYLYGLSLGGFLAQHYVRRYPNMISKLIISHSGTTKSKTIINKVIKPGKLYYFFIPIIPQWFLNKIFKPIAVRVQSGQSNIIKLYEQYSTKENYQRRHDFSKKTTFSMIDKNYLKTVYCLGIEMEKQEKSVNFADFQNWKGKILIIRTDNDPLAQDDGVFKEYYPSAQVYTFHETGHLTPFIQTEKMIEVIDKFIHDKK